MAQDDAMALTTRLEGSIAAALPSHITKEHFARALLTSFRKTPKLTQCTDKSVGGAVVTAAQLGLMPNVNGAAYLIPYKTECVLVIGYQGLIDLCYRSGMVESISADTVCENDEFDYEQGLNQRLCHKPKLNGPRGEAYAVYAIARIKGSDTPVYVVLNKEEILNVKNSSAGAKTKDSPWNGKFQSEMWKKTAIRRLSKLLPKSVELNTALEFENQQEERMKWADAEEVDPLAAGKHEKKSAFVEGLKDVALLNKPSEAYPQLMDMYNLYQEDIDQMLSQNGLSSLDSMDGENITMKQEEILTVILIEVKRMAQA